MSGGRRTSPHPKTCASKREYGELHHKEAQTSSTCGPTKSCRARASLKSGFHFVIPHPIRNCKTDLTCHSLDQSCHVSSEHTPLSDVAAVASQEVSSVVISVCLPLAAKQLPTPRKRVTNIKRRMPILWSFNAPFLASAQKGTMRRRTHVCSFRGLIKSWREHASCPAEALPSVLVSMSHVQPCSNEAV